MSSTTYVLVECRDCGHLLQNHKAIPSEFFKNDTKYICELPMCRCEFHSIGLATIGRYWKIHVKYNYDDVQYVY